VLWAAEGENGTQLVTVRVPQGEEGDLYTVGVEVRIMSEDGDVAATIETRRLPFARMVQLDQDTYDSDRGGVVTRRLPHRAQIHYGPRPAVSFYPPGEILITLGDESALRWYGLDGRVKRQVRIDLVPEPVTDEDRALVRDRYDRLIETALQDPRGEGLAAQLERELEVLQFPDEKAFWGHHMVEEGSGYVWLHVPKPTFGAYVVGSLPVTQQEEFRVLAPDGEFLGFTSWPEEISMFGSSVARGHLLAMVPDPETQETVPTVYRIRPAVAGLEYH
jgi:hypothetical protein